MSPSSSVIPTLQVTVSRLLGELGVIEWVLITGGTLEIMRLLSVKFPSAYPSLGVTRTVQRSPFCVLLESRLALVMPVV